MGGGWIRMTKLEKLTWVKHRRFEEADLEEHLPDKVFTKFLYIRVTIRKYKTVWTVGAHYELPEEIAWNPHQPSEPTGNIQFVKLYSHDLSKLTSDYEFNRMIEVIVELLMSMEE
jgi:hypothetical protein